MNPIDRTVTIVFACIAVPLILFFLFTFWECPSLCIGWGELLFGIFYLLPVIGLVAFAITSILDKEWFISNLKQSIAFIILLIVWLLIVLYYLKNLMMSTY